MCEPSDLHVCRRLVVCGPTHGIRVIVSQSSLLGGIRWSSSLSWIRRRWSSLGGFIVVGLDLPALVLLRWVGCLAIARCWGIFADVGLGWVDSSSLASVGPSLLDLIRRESSSLGQVRRCWLLLGSSCPRWSYSRWPFVFGRNSLRLVGVYRRWAGFACCGPPTVVVSPSFVTLYPPHSPLCSTLLTHLLSPSLAPSFPPPSRPHPFRKGRGD